MTGDATLYAIWNAQTYNIAYKDQGDDECGKNQQSGEEQVLILHSRKAADGKIIIGSQQVGIQIGNKGDGGIEQGAHRDPR